MDFTEQKSHTLLKMYKLEQKISCCPFEISHHCGQKTNIDLTPLMIRKMNECSYNILTMKNVYIQLKVELNPSI